MDDKMKWLKEEGGTKENTNKNYRLAVCQFEPVFLDKTANLNKIEDMAQRSVLAGAQLVIFPECCITGYKPGKSLINIAEQAEVIKGNDRGPSVRRMEKLSDDLKAQFIFGVPELSDETTYNSAVHVAPGKGVVGSYHKVHMWESEGEVFLEGDEFFVRNAPAGRLGSLICYDLEFPEASRILALMGAHLIAVSTANRVPWGKYQCVFARSRAMENSVFVAVANCIGKIGSKEFFGGSIIVDPYGRVLTEAGDSEAILIADINIETVDKAAKETEYFKKRRVGIYGRICS
jgi:(R)-amidase